MHLYSTFVFLYSLFVHLYSTFVFLYSTFAHLYSTFVHLYSTFVHLYSTFVFPHNVSPKENLSSQAQWFVEYNWLDYNENNNNITCFICKKHQQQLDQEKNKEYSFLRSGFRNWEKVLTSSRDHQQSNCHLAALTLEVTVLPCGNILEMTSEVHKAKMKENRKCLNKIIESLQYHGRQNFKR